MSPAILERGHVMRLVLPPGPCWADADAARFEQVIVNLLLNATKYTPHGGEIELTLQQTDDSISVSVRDTGEGIEPDKLERVFELFARASKAGEPGFGIGLAVARRLVEQHGGSLRAVSGGAGQGSEFLIQLPNASPVAERRQA